jgi:flagellar motor switch protein FliN/FliY
MTQDEIDNLLGTGGSTESTGEISSQRKIDVQAAEFEAFDKSQPSKDRKDHKIDMLIDLSLPVAIELGKTNMMIKDILELERGSIIEFDKMASEPVDILINGKKMAEGEVVVIDKHFGIRITSLTEPSERLRNLRR